MIETKTFALAGNATFTVTSRKTGVRFTFKVRQPRPETPHFVSLMTGADNENDFAYFGFITAKGEFVHAKPEKSRITPEAPSAKGFAWLWRNIDNAPKLAEQVEIHHEGRCCRCGRKLTVPESVESGIGPECAAMMGF